MVIITIFFQMLALVIMIGAGYCMTKRKMLDEHTNSHMSSMIANVFNPLLVFSSAVNSVGLVSIKKMGIVGIVAICMFLFFIVIGMILSPFFDKDKEQRKIFQMMFVFSNLGFIGIPVVSSILGAEYVVYVMEFMLVYSFVFYTYGVTLMEGKFSLSSLKTMVNPGTIFSVASLLVIIFNIRIPGFIGTAVTYLGNVASPMALVAVGFSLAHTDLRKIFGEMRLYIFSVINLLVLPLIMLPALNFIMPDAELIPVCMVMFGMPIGNMPLILGTEKGMDVTTCSAAIILSTILCVFTVPILIAAAAAFR